MTEITSLNFSTWNIHLSCDCLKYRKFTSSRLSQLVAHLRIFRLFMKGNLDAYALWPLAKKAQNWIVDRSTAHQAKYATRNFTVWEITLWPGISYLNFALVWLNKCIRKSTMAPTAAGLMNDSHECNDMKMLEIDMHCWFLLCVT